MATINQPCYCTREEVRRALDVKQAAYNDAQIDRNIIAGTDAVEGLCQRKFYPLDATHKFDWPNFQYSYPWKLYLDQYELAAPPTLLVSGTFLPNPVVIPSANYILQPINEGPPFTWLELRRDQSSSFGNNPTPQLDIGITGTFGYWTRTAPAGQLAAALIDTTGTTVQVSVGDGALGAGVGDVLICDSERMIVTDSNFVNTGISFISGCTTLSAADNTLVVPDGTKFSKDETVLIDSEWLLILAVVGNSLLVKRAWDGSALAVHAPGPVWAKRSLTALRGQLGTSPATHTVNTPLVISLVPGLVKELALAYSLVGFIQEPTGYAMSMQKTWYGQEVRGQGSQKEAAPGPGLPSLEERVFTRYARKIRTRVV